MGDGQKGGRLIRNPLILLKVGENPPPTIAPPTSPTKNRRKRAGKLDFLKVGDGWAAGWARVPYLEGAYRSPYGSLGPVRIPQELLKPLAVEMFLEGEI